MFKIRRHITILISVIILILAYHFSQSIDIISLLRLKTQDFYWNIKYNLSKTSLDTKDIVLVPIDEEAYNYYDKKWPWGREIFALLVYNISQDSPKVIGLNFGFIREDQEPEGELKDLLLKEAFQSAGNVITASYFGDQGKYYIPDDYFIKSLKDYGFTNKPTDFDGVIRYTRLFAGLSGNTPSKIILDYCFELKLICAYLDIPFANIFNDNQVLTLFKNDRKQIKIPVNNEEYIFINYSVNLEDLAVVPVLDVMDNNFQKGQFKDKIVIVGPVGEQFKERYLTPFGSRNGLEVIANSIIMILNENYVYILPKTLDLLIFIIMISLATYCFWRQGGLKGFIALLVFIFCFFVISLILVLSNIIMDFFSIPIFVIIAFIELETIRYGTLFVESVRLKNLSIKDTETGLVNRRYFMYKLENNLIAANRERRHLAFVIISIDNYNFIMSSMGVEEADKILKETAVIVKKNSRQYRRGDIVARYGDHDFGVLLKDASLQGAMKYIERIKESIEREKKDITLSIGGTSTSVVNTGSVSAFTECAERALERGKQGSTDKISFYDSTLDVVDFNIHKGQKEISETDLNFVARELEEKNKELINTIRELKSLYNELAKTERLTAMGKLASSIHHELNNPICALKGCLQTMGTLLSKIEENESVKKVKYFASAGIEEIKRLEELSVGLKDLYKPHKKALEPVAVNKILSGILSLLKLELVKRKVELITQYAEEVPDVKAVGTELKQVFLNIVINAIDAMSPNGKLTIETVYNDSNKTVEVKINDTGCGIAPEDLDKIFEMFFSTKTDTKGSGIGLYVTKQIIDRFNGTIKVDSILNKGTTFTIVFPVGAQ